MALSIANSEPEIPLIKTITQIEKQLEVKEPTFEEISAPLVAEGKKRREREECEARGGYLEASECIVPVYTPPTPTVAPEPLKTPVVSGNGYIVPGFNCVECVRRLTGRAQNANAGYWSASHSVPRIGDVMIFAPGEQGASWAGHVGVVTGINADGTVNIAHCNWWSGQTTFFSTGKFW